MLSPVTFFLLGFSRIQKATRDDDGRRPHPDERMRRVREGVHHVHVLLHIRLLPRPALLVVDRLIFFYIIPSTRTYDPIASGSPSTASSA